MGPEGGYGEGSLTGGGGGDRDEIIISFFLRL